MFDTFKYYDEEEYISFCILFHHNSRVYGNIYKSRSILFFSLNACKESMAIEGFFITIFSYISELEFIHA